MKKLIIFLVIFIITILVVGGGTFYGGIKYQESKSPAARFSTEERQRMAQGSAGDGFRQTMGVRGILVAGEVIARDDPEGEQAPYGAGQSITLKTPDGSSRIVFFSDSTEISKMSEGKIEDVEIGKKVTISGDQNADGSYTARTIQISILWDERPI